MKLAWMKRIPITILLLLVGISSFRVVSANNEEGGYRRVIITYKPTSSINSDGTAAIPSGRVTAEISAAKVYNYLDPQNAIAATYSEETIEELRNNPDIERIEDDSIVYAYDYDHATSNSYLRSFSDRDRGFRNDLRHLQKTRQKTPFGIGMVQADQVDNKSSCRKSVCVIDSGYYIEHEDLPDQSDDVTGKSFVSGCTLSDNCPWDKDFGGHGTHVAGTIAAINNDIGVVGTTNDVLLLIARVFEDDSAYTSDIIMAINWCVDEQADVINMSLGRYGYEKASKFAVDRAYDNGILIVAAAGNSGTTDYGYPASHDSVISVSAIDRNKEWADFSNENDQVELSAPGFGVLSTCIEKEEFYCKNTGTSMASPHVAGVAATIWSHYPGCTNKEIRTALRESAEQMGTPTPRNDKFGYGIVQAKAALTYLENNPCVNLEKCGESFAPSVSSQPTLSSSPSNKPSSSISPSTIPSSIPTSIPSSSISPSTSFIPTSYWSNVSWEQQGMTIAGKSVDDVAGTSVAISGDGTTLAFGAPGSERPGYVEVYYKQSDSTGSWNWVLGGTFEGDTNGDLFGNSVSLSQNGKMLAVGSPGWVYSADRPGYVRVYMKEDDEWTQLGEAIEGDANGNMFGWSVSISSDGTTVAIGAPTNDDFSGYVRVYEAVEDGEEGMASWQKVGQNIDGENEDDLSGWSVSLSADGMTVAIGAVWNDDGGVDSGHARIYTLIDGEWEKLGQDIDGQNPGDEFGTSVSISSDGLTVAVGAPYNNDNGDFSGKVQVYRLNNGEWSQVGQDLIGAAIEDRSGWSVSLSNDGNTLAIGAWGNDNGNGDDAGHVRVYHLVGSENSLSWIQVGDDLYGANAGDYAGTSVSLSSNGNEVAVGSDYNDDNGENSGHVRVFAFLHDTDATLPPSKSPTASPSKQPTGSPTSSPVLKPVTPPPTTAPPTTPKPSSPKPTTAKPSKSPSEAPTFSPTTGKPTPTPFQPVVTQFFNTTVTVDNVGAGTPDLPDDRRLQGISCASENEVVLENTTAGIVMSNLPSDQKLASVDTIECTLIGNVMIVIQMLGIDVSCNASCTETAEGLEQSNEIAKNINTTMNDSVEYGNYTKSIRENAEECGSACNDLVVASVNEKVVVVEGDVVVTSQAPSSSPTRKMKSKGSKRGKSTKGSKAGSSASAKAKKNISLPSTSNTTSIATMTRKRIRKHAQTNAYLVLPGNASDEE